MTQLCHVAQLTGCMRKQGMPKSALPPGLPTTQLQVHKLHCALAFAWFAILASATHVLHWRVEHLAPAAVALPTSWLPALPTLTTLPQQHTECMSKDHADGDYG